MPAGPRDHVTLPGHGQRSHAGALREQFQGGANRLLHTVRFPPDQCLGFRRVRAHDVGTIKHPAPGLLVLGSPIGHDQRIFPAGIKRGRHGGTGLLELDEDSIRGPQNPAARLHVRSAKQHTLVDAFNQPPDPRRTDEVQQQRGLRTVTPHHSADAHAVVASLLEDLAPRNVLPDYSNQLDPCAELAACHALVSALAAQQLSAPAHRRRASLLRHLVDRQHKVPRHLSHDDDQRLARPALSRRSANRLLQSTPLGPLSGNSIIVPRSPRGMGEFTDIGTRPKARRRD